MVKVVQSLLTYNTLGILHERLPAHGLRAQDSVSISFPTQLLLLGELEPTQTLFLLRDPIPHVTEHPLHEFQPLHDAGAKKEHNQSCNGAKSEVKIFWM